MLDCDCANKIPEVNRITDNMSKIRFNVTNLHFIMSMIVRFFCLCNVKTLYRKTNYKPVSWKRFLFLF